jgi:SAM-dependent methyltransferase
MPAAENNPGVVTPSPPLAASDLERIYENRFSTAIDYRDQVWRVLTMGFFSRWIPADSSVLDLGCGYCEFINNIPAAKKYAMDLNPEAGRRAGAGVTWPLADGTLDVVFTSNFVEHLATKDMLERTLCEAARCLRSGGKLIAMGPNIRYVGGAYWDFYDHYLPLTELSFGEVLRKLGFLIDTNEPRFLPYTMSSGKRYPLWVLRTYLALRPAWRLFGKQFLIMACKR